MSPSRTDIAVEPANLARDPINIRVEGLKAAFGDSVILKDVSFEVRRGSIFVLLGGSGCGKSTLLKHMIGLYRPAAGRVIIERDDIARASDDDLRAILRRIGVAYQSGALFGSLTLEENVSLPLEELTDLPSEAIREIASIKLGLVGLSGFEQHFPAEISGGMQKRAAIARAMALDPPILFLDEPSAGLDPITSAQLDDLILHLSRDLDITFVVVSHELPSIYTIADEAIMLDREAKGIIARGRPAELRDESTNPWVRKFFRREA